MDASKPGKGILASLEHRKASAATPPLAARARALVVGSGLLLGLALTWWVYSGPSPVRAQDEPPAARYEVALPMPPAPRPLPDEAAAIIDEAVPPAAPRQAVLAAVAPAPIATVRRERVAAVKPHQKPRQKPEARAGEAPLPRAVSDSDVALLTALVAHANERDVVEPRLADSTASLLQRCQRVGGEEGRLCRARICTARGTDPECRAD